MKHPHDNQLTLLQQKESNNLNHETNKYERSFNIRSSVVQGNGNSNGELDN
jgi:hypothetical protein